MGLKDIFRRWSKGEDERALERGERESKMDEHERSVDREDFEGLKDDTAARARWGGAEAESAATDDI